MPSILYSDKENDFLIYVLNLVISGMPSILWYPTIPRCYASRVLNLVISGMPSILMAEASAS